VGRRERPGERERAILAPREVDARPIELEGHADPAVAEVGEVQKDARSGDGEDPVTLGIEHLEPENLDAAVGEHRDAREPERPEDLLVEPADHICSSSQRTTVRATISRPPGVQAKSAALDSVTPASANAPSTSQPTARSRRATTII
jgi:hypothetical protein